MTQAPDQSVREARALAGAPWPLVERRAQPRPIASPEMAALQRLPMQSNGEHETTTPGSTAHRNPLPSKEPRSIPAAAHAAVLFVDLLGVALVLWLPMHVVGEPMWSPVALATVWSAALAVFGTPWAGSRAERPRLLLLAGLTVATVSAVASYATGCELPHALVLVALPLAAACSTGARAQVLRRNPVEVRAVLVGTPHLVAPTLELLRRATRPAVRVVAVCCPNPAVAPRAINGVPVVGDLDEVAPTVWRSGVGNVIVTSEGETTGPVLRKLAWDIEGSGAAVLVYPGIVELDRSRLHLHRVGGLPVLTIREPSNSGGLHIVKALIDRVLAAFALVLMAPLFVGIGLAIRLNSPGPALFTQRRVGRDGQEFVLLKFRTMRTDAEELLAELEHENKHRTGPLFKMSDDPRVTSIGSVLRRYSLDELPQLVNVVRGEMSLVGPRPPLPTEVERYDQVVPRRLLMRPGMTGLWQVSGRSDLTWDQSCLLDLRYVENWSLRLDISILWRTFGAVLGGRGAY